MSLTDLTIVNKAIGVFIATLLLITTIVFIQYLWWKYYYHVKFIEKYKISQASLQLKCYLHFCDGLISVCKIFFIVYQILSIQLWFDHCAQFQISELEVSSECSSNKYCSVDHGRNRATKEDGFKCNPPSGIIVIWVFSWIIGIVTLIFIITTPCCQCSYFRYVRYFRYICYYLIIIAWIAVNFVVEFFLKEEIIDFVVAFVLVSMLYIVNEFAIYSFIQSRSVYDEKKHILYLLETVFGTTIASIICFEYLEHMRFVYVSKNQKKQKRKQKEYLDQNKIEIQVREEPTYNLSKMDKDFFKKLAQKHV